MSSLFAFLEFLPEKHFRPFLQRHVFGFTPCVESGKGIIGGREEPSLGVGHFGEVIFNEGCEFCRGRTEGSGARFAFLICLGGARGVTGIAEVTGRNDFAMGTLCGSGRGVEVRLGLVFFDIFFVESLCF